MNKLTIDTIQLNGVTFDVVIYKFSTHSEKKGHGLNCEIGKRGNGRIPELSDIVTFFENNPEGELSVEVGSQPVIMNLLNYDFDGVSQEATLTLSKETPTAPNNIRTKKG